MVVLLDEKQRFSYERSGYDLEESDGPDEDDNENEEDDEDSQAESVLSAAPSVTASPQHLPSRSGLQDTVSADEELHVTDCFSAAHTDPTDVLPRALLTKMTVLRTVQSDHSRKTNSPGKVRQQAAKDEDGTIASVEAARSPEAAPRSPCHQMSVDYPKSEVLRSSMAGKTVTSTQVDDWLCLFSFVTCYIWEPNSITNNAPKQFAMSKAVYIISLLYLVAEIIYVHWNLVKYLNKRSHIVL